MTTLLTIAVSLLVFGVVIFVHELGHFLAAKRSGIQVNEFAIGMGPALWQKEKDGTLYSVRLLPVGGFTAMEGEDGEEDEADEAEPSLPVQKAAPKEQWPAVVAGKPFAEATIGQRMLVIAAGALMNFVLGMAVLLALQIGQEGPLTSKVIYQFYEGALSAQTGLQPGDEVLAVNGHYCFVASDIIYELQRTPNYTADFTVRRGGQRVEVPGVQFGTQTAEDGSVSMVVEFSVYGIAKTPRTVAKAAVCEFAYYARAIARSLADLVLGRVSINEMSGPVGIVSAIGEAVGYGWQDVLSLMALITINLGIFNLLPFPALDGGRLVFLAAEALLRRPVPTKVQAAVNALGMALLLMLMAFVTFQDITRFL